MVAGRGIVRNYGRNNNSPATGEKEALIIQGVLDLVHRIDGKPDKFQFLTARSAQSSATFSRQFEKDTGQRFTPSNFRRHRLKQISQADAIVVIRTGLSESTAFELAYNIFGGPAVPIFFAIWHQAPLKTSLLQDLQEIVSVRLCNVFEPGRACRASSRFPGGPA